MPKYITPEQKLSVIEGWLNGELEKILLEDTILEVELFIILCMNGAIVLVLKKQRY